MMVVVGIEHTIHNPSVCRQKMRKTSSTQEPLHPSIREEIEVRKLEVPSIVEQSLDRSNNPQVCHNLWITETAPFLSSESSMTLTRHGNVMTRLR
jgi:hypothetical protein